MTGTTSSLPDRRHTRPLRTRPTRRDSGFTILELTVYAALAGLLSAPLVSAMLVGTRASTDTDQHAWMQERNRSTLHKVTKDIRNSIGSTLVIDTAANTMTFSLPDGFDGVNVIVGPTIQYEFRTVAGADWGELVRIDFRTGEERSVSGGIDIANSQFAPEDDGVRVTLVHAVDPNDPTAVNVRSSVASFPRN